MFDVVVMVDWSSRSVPALGKDSIWIGWGESPNMVHRPINVATRQQALRWLTENLRAWAADQRRVLVGFDFAYGYPSGFAQLLGLRGDDHNRWRNIWSRLSEMSNAADPGFDRDNAFNKFAVANDVNSQLHSTFQVPEGPFWGRPDWTRTSAVLNQLPNEIRNAPPFTPAKGGGAGRRHILERLGIQPTDHPRLRMTSPAFPMHIGETVLAQFRITEQRAGQMGHPKSAWQLSGNGAVGGQVLAGLPYLHALITDPMLAPISKVWPFETGFANPLETRPGAFIVHAEIYPSNLKAHAEVPAGLTVADARQIWTHVRTTLDKDAGGTLACCFNQPPNLTPDQNMKVIQEEGWILFGV